MIFRQFLTTVELVGSTDVSQVLSTLRRAVENGSFVISEAVLARLRDRGLSHRDVGNALANATAFDPSPAGEGRWMIRGPSVDGEEIALSVAIDSGIVMVI